MISLRNKMIKLLQEEEKLNEIVQLVGEDVLPNDQALVMETARMIKKGFLQQNALHPEDTYVNLNKQYKMLKVIDVFYDNALLCVKMDIPISTIRSLSICQDILKMKYDILKMKYDIPNDNINLLDDLINRIIKTLSDLRQKYE